MTVSSSLRAWSPVLIGFIFCTFMYGTTVGQAIYYSYSFPDDPRATKALVLGVFLADTVSLIGSTQLIWTFFVSCHRSESWSCDHDLPRGGLAMTCFDVIIIFIVQCFYCRRIWIISGQNKLLTSAMFFLAIVGFASGVWYNVDIARVGSLQYLYHCPLMLPALGTGILYDILITSSIIKYMWRSSFQGQRTTVQDLAVVWINMGVFTCIISIITGVLFLAQHSSFWVASLGMMIGHSYVSSMLAVLNARKAIRDREPIIYELPTI